MKTNEKFTVVALAIACGITTAPSWSAENLSVAPGISYVSDIGTVFPLIGDRMDDYVIEAGKPTLIFFGATGDLNTNRQAKRLVELYRKDKAKATKFIVVNVDNPTNAGARELIKKHYPGYVPAQLLLDSNGKILWSQVGEVSRRKLSGHINGAM